MEDNQGHGGTLELGFLRMGVHCCLSVYSLKSDLAIKDANCLSEKKNKTGDKNRKVNSSGNDMGI